MISWVRIMTFSSLWLLRFDVDKNPNWFHDGIIKWKHFRRHWPLVRGIHRSLLISPHKGQWCGALTCAWINGWVKKNNWDTGDLRHHRAHYDVTVLCLENLLVILSTRALRRWHTAATLQKHWLAKNTKYKGPLTGWFGWSQISLP